MAEPGNDTKSIQERGWLKLDNAAKLFPAITSEELTSVFRIMATLKRPVMYSALRKAVEITSGRFPYFNVSLGSGLFWHFLEYHDQIPRIQVEEKIPCTAFAVRRRNELLYRILVRSNRISVEFIHILTDGAGAFEFMKTLLHTYLSLTGNGTLSSEGIILPGSAITAEETEDGYNKCFKKLPPPDKLSKAWHLPFPLNDKPRLRVIRAEIPVAQILELSRGQNVSLTEYFVAVYLFSLQSIYLETEKKGKKQKYRVLRTEVPVNMRNKLPSRTLRNFSLFIMPEIDLRLGTYTFGEVLKAVHLYMQAGSEIKQLARFLSSNVSHEKQVIIRVLPLFIKRMAIAAIYIGLGSKRSSGIVTNLGTWSLPAGMTGEVESMEIIPTPPNSRVKVSCAMVSYKEKLRVTFCNITGSHDLERLILKHFTDSGIHVKLLSNFD